MKKPTGRPHKLPYEVRKAIAESVVAREMTYRQAATKYQISAGAVSTCVKEFKGGGIKKTNPPKWIADQQKTDKEKALEQENLALKAELGDLYLQNKMLKKAESYIQWLRSESSSVITSENWEQYKEDVN
jgi:transposase